MDDLYTKVKAAENRLSTLPFTFSIGAEHFSVKDLQEWQRREYLKTAKLLNKLVGTDLKLTAEMPLVDMKTAVIAEKIRVGQDTLKDALESQTKLANLASKVGVITSLKRNKVAIADIYLDNSPISAKEIISTFNRMMTENSSQNQYYNFKANPNHFYSTGSASDQTVVEMTGGTRIANQFTLLYGKEKGLKTKRNRSFTYQAVGTGQLDDGFIIGGVRHEMTDESNRFHARLQVEFPAILPNFIIRQHAVHLLVEFSNWLTDIVMLHEK
ncbi:hypothetical protein [Lentilactobacillus sp. Marseille-Q4993]|uniref:hypothetical protein n=1 Tax=Lentilactobacillus sp. Marseille-Q4993 TaxID=3039492 RepID=UPI0024BC518B|nr:hypothetical protein [Lentilactobacillus sp. Marseille-Q4993]